jgi:hypothetical protein
MYSSVVTSKVELQLLALFGVRLVAVEESPPIHEPLVAGRI